MSENKYAYHKQFQGIQEEDRAEVLRKDKSYGASWKKRGGVGAYMMLARKWDRIEEITEGKHHHDIFEAVAQGGMGGEDGTILAEVRDLRRYLLLVEAEMLHRHKESVLIEAQTGNLYGAVPEGSYVEPLPRTLQKPIVDGDHKGDAAIVPRRVRDVPDGTETPPPLLEPVPYFLLGGRYYVARNKMTPAELSCLRLSRLQRELNTYEINQSGMGKYQPLYEWDQAESKWKLRPEYEAWT